MEEIKWGPNGGLVFCIEYLSQNMEWLEDDLSQFDEDGYFLFDCPCLCWALSMKGRPDRTLLPLFLPGRHTAFGFRLVSVYLVIMRNGCSS